MPYVMWFEKILNLTNLKVGNFRRTLLWLNVGIENQFLLKLVSSTQDLAGV